MSGSGEKRADEKITLAGCEIMILSKSEMLSILHEYKNNFAGKYGILSLGVFGSVARDQCREDSDVDICVTTMTPDPFSLVHIKEDIEKRVHRPVDIVRIRDSMNSFLKARIEKEGIFV